MKWLEIISLRTSGHFEQQARNYMKKFCRIVKKYKLSEVDFYIHASSPGDLALVISSRSQEEKDKVKDLVTYMADVLKKFGLVDHNCWLQIDEK
jgi:hypothetical protein